MCDLINRCQDLSSKVLRQAATTVLLRVEDLRLIGGTKALRGSAVVVAAPDR